ncbi:MAG: DUF4405 domain-containing protein [Campylobacterota bacterium]|nr:DUF4405 domain-containing protein [Campylobacterota bacterium]
MKTTLKKISSLSLGFSFLIMSYTGVILFFVPKGKIAYWVDWHLFGLTKSQYGEIHTTSMLVFLLFGILHIYFNFKPIVSYLKDKNKKVSFTKKEFLIALGINVFFVVGTLYMVQPFKAYLDLGESIKDYWAKEYGEPPYGHAEETKLKDFCRKMDIDYDEANKILLKNGFVFHANQNLLSIAKQNRTSPAEIHNLISVNSPKKDSSIPSNLGRKTLEKLADMKKIDLDKSLILLKSKGLKNISENSKIRNIADELGVTPLNVYNLLVEKKQRF